MEDSQFFKIGESSGHEPTRKEMYILGLYDGLWQFNDDIDGEQDMLDASDAIMERMQAAKRGEWEFPE